MRPSLLTATILLLQAVALQADVVTIPHAEVTYVGADVKWAKAMAEIMATARSIYVDEFASDMPETVHGELTVKAGEKTRLYTDGDAAMFLSVPSESKLAQPKKSGVFNLYGLCHELGHVAMYRVLKNRDWMTGDAAEGWAHYAGSVVTDRVYALKGESAWPDPYDYRADGTARLKKQLAEKSVDGVTQAAGEWQKLAVIVGQKGVAKIFAAWQAANVQPEKATDSLLSAAIKVFPDKRDELTSWWKSAAKVLVKSGISSSFQGVTIAASKLTGKPVMLTFDDDQQDGKRSLGGSGHARKFSAPDEGEWYIRSVSVCGAQYGNGKNATFDVILCDPELRQLSSWKKPYDTFKPGDLAWTRLAVAPTRVPKEFYICLNFRPERTRGVYVAFDSSTKGNSVSGIPGGKAKPLTEGDWMIRVELDKPKAGVASQPSAASE
jgi:RNA polymerase sigma-70 factor (ECF subfamily)